MDKQKRITQSDTIGSIPNLIISFYPVNLFEMGPLVFISNPAHQCGFKNGFCALLLNLVASNKMARAVSFFRIDHDTIIQIYDF